MGVRRAVDMVLDASNKTKSPICTYGPLIHNPQVMDMLREKGIPTIDEIPEKGTGTALIRAHGVPPQDQEKLKKAGFEVINATCPRVIRVQTIIRKHSKKGFSTIIMGDKDHPEVKGLLGYADNRGYIASTMEELDKLPKFDQAVVVAQTTQDTSLYHQVKIWVEKQYPHYKFYNTICDSTEKRQAEVRNIAAKNDAVIVVGGKNSGNTKRLAEIAEETGKPCLHIEDVSELDMETFSSAKSIAIAAGASTPNWIISQTYRAIEDKLKTKHSSLNNFFLKIKNFLLRSNFLLSAGAGSLTYACSSLQGIEHNLVYACIAMLYVLSMQIINNFFSIQSDKYNNPERAKFYDANKNILSFTALISGVIGLYLSFRIGWIPFCLLSIMSIFGMLYNKKIFSVFTKNSKIKTIKDIPGSKTVLTAVAWGIVTSILPSISLPLTLSLIPCFIFTTSMVFARTAFFAVLEIQGDRITGKETLPILLGEVKSMKLIKQILLLASSILVFSSLIGIIEIIGIVFAFLPLLMLLFIKYSEKGNIYSGMKLEFLVESHFILAGVIATLF